MKSQCLVKSFYPVLFTTVLGACDATTGGQRVTFKAAAAGAADLPGGALTFSNSLGWSVALTRAKVHLGGLYLNQTVFGGGPEMALGCYSSGIYSAEVLAGLDVDALDPTPQPFPVAGEGITQEARSAEVWLNGGPIDAADDATIILDVAGTASLDANAIPFRGALTIGSNRAIPNPNPALPGLNPICQQRIVRPIVFDVTPSQGGTLLVRIDPRRLFSAVDFSTLPKVSNAPPLYQFADAAKNAADELLYSALRSPSGTYHFEWTK